MEFKYEGALTPDAVCIEFKENDAVHRFPIMLEDMREAVLKMADPTYFGELSLRLKTPVTCSGIYAGVTMQHIILEVEGPVVRFTYFTNDMQRRAFERKSIIRVFRELIKSLSKE